MRQVRVAENVLPQAGLVVVLKTVIALVPQVSEAVGASKIHASPHWTTLLETQVTSGGTLSNTVTVWPHWNELLQASVTVQVRVAVKVLPQSWFVSVLNMAIEFVPQVSLAVGGSKVHGVPQATDLLVGQFAWGGVVSMTVTV
jgi:hypothetical protein